MRLSAPPPALSWRKTARAEARQAPKTEQDLGTKQSSKSVRWMLNYFSSDENKLKQKPNNLEFKMKNKNIPTHPPKKQKNYHQPWQWWQTVTWIFLKGLKKATATHKVFKSISVDATQRHIDREKYTGQKGWGENRLVGWPGLGATTDSWVSHRRDSQHLLFFWFSRTQGWQRLGKRSLCSDNFQSWARGNCLREITGDQISSLIVLLHSLFLLPFSQKAD